MEDRDRRPVGAAMLASLFAGPIFVIGTAASFFMTADYAPGLESAVAWVFIMPVAIGIGFILSILPNLIGTVALHALGQTNIGMRLPVAWIVIGGIAAGACAAALGVPDDLIAIVAFTGASSAGLCRYGAVWS